LTLKSVRLSDVAQRAGVSTASVSRVLNSPERVSAALRRQVEEALKELRYVPHGAARALASQRSRRSVSVSLLAADVVAWAAWVSVAGGREAPATWFWVGLLVELLVELGSGTSFVGAGWQHAMSNVPATTIARHASPPSRPMPRSSPGRRGPHNACAHGD
jgi:hypothetical protein